MNIILKLRKMSTITKQRPILNIYTGPMFAGKTTRLIKHFNSIEVDNELEKIPFKFSKDTTDMKLIRTKIIQIF